MASDIEYLAPGLTRSLLDATDARIKAKREAAQASRPGPDYQVQWYDVGPAGAIGSAGTGLNEALLGIGDLIPDMLGQPDWMDQNVPLWRDYRGSVEGRRATLSNPENPSVVTNNLAALAGAAVPGMGAATKLLAPAETFLKASRLGKAGFQTLRAAGGGLLSATYLHPEELPSDLTALDPVDPYEQSVQAGADDPALAAYLAAPPAPAAFGSFSEEAKAEAKLRAAIVAQFGPERAPGLLLIFKGSKLIKAGRVAEGRALQAEGERLLGALPPAQTLERLEQP